MANVVTPVFRVSFPNVFKAKLNKLSGKEEYGCVALFDKGQDLTVLNKAAEKAMIAKWGADKSKWPKNLRSPFRDQADRAKEMNGKMVMPDGHEEGAIFINMKAQQKPGVVGQDVQPIMDDAEFYAGCYARASVSVYAYDQAGNRGVSFGLVNIQKVKDGDPLGNRTRPDQDFAPIAGAEASSADDLFS